MTTDIGSNPDRYWMYMAAFALSSGLVATATPWAISLAARLRWVDMPDSRKVHSQPIPRVGGIAVFAGIFGAFAILAFASNAASELIRTNMRAFIALAAGSTLLFLTGLWDDVRGISPRMKLIMQALAGVIAYSGGLHFVLFHDGAAAMGLPSLGIMFSLFLTVLWTAGTTNAINLIDGLDGLASGIVGIAMVVLGILSELNHHPATAFAAFLSAGAVAGFLVFNRHPAVIFLGDSGSLLMGFLVSVLAIEGTRQAEYASLVLPACLVLVPLLDMCLAMWRRVQKGLPITSADNLHIHHRLLRKGISHRKVVHILWGISSIAGALALAMHFTPAGYRQALVNLTALVLLLTAVWYLGKLELHAMVGGLRTINRRKMTPRGRVLRLRKSLHQVGKCASAQGALQVLARIASDLEIESMKVLLESRTGPGEVIEILSWNRNQAAVEHADDPGHVVPQDTISATKPFALDPDSAVLVQLVRHGWKSRRRSEDFQLWANLVAEKVSNLEAFSIFSPARSLPYSAILEPK